MQIKNENNNEFPKIIAEKFEHCNVNWYKLTYLLELLAGGVQADPCKPIIHKFIIQEQKIEVTTN